MSPRYRHRAPIRLDETVAVPRLASLEDVDLARKFITSAGAAVALRFISVPFATRIVTVRADLDEEATQ